MKRLIIILALTILVSLVANAQQEDFLNPPKENEIAFATFSSSFLISNALSYNERIHLLYDDMLKEAKNKFPNIAVDIREMKHRFARTFNPNINEYNVDCTVVYVMSKKEQAEKLEKVLSQALDKALLKVDEGARMAIDQITIQNSTDREELKDQLIDILLKKGYRVVAKEHLQKLYKEQEDQLKSGFYNPDTTVEGSNFSAVGYFINVKVTESSIRVQVVNVSTGEYEGNATVNF